jgi:hypothetical protein
MSALRRPYPARKRRCRRRRWVVTGFGNSDAAVRGHFADYVDAFDFPSSNRCLRGRFWNSIVLHHSWRRGPRSYFDFFGTRFFGLGPDPPEASPSSPRHGQSFLNASIARVIPASFNRSGLLSRYRNRTLTLSKMLPCAGGHARTSAGRFGEKSIAVSIIPSHEPADRASPLS